VSTAWVFPGHGSQYVGMGQALLRDTLQGRAWLAHAEEVSGLPLGDYAAHGPVAQLARPTVLEPLLAAVSCAYVDWLRAADLRPAAVAGYSAGEVAAMYAARVFDAETCLRIACLRGEALAAAALPGGMISLHGLPVAELIELVVEVGQDESVGVAAYNGPRHLIVAGSPIALARVAARGHALGAEAGALDAAGPWHTRLADTARRQLIAALAALPFAMPCIPVWLGSSGAACGDSAALRRSLADSIVLPVRWNALVDGLLAAGIEDFLEVGPGRTLYGLLGQMPLPPQIRRGFLERPGLKRLRPPTPPQHHYQNLRKA